MIWKVGDKIIDKNTTLTVVEVTPNKPGSNRSNWISATDESGRNRLYGDQSTLENSGIKNVTSN